MPNIPETVASLLACASIGAVWSSAAPEFGARSVIDRFSQIEPKVLLAVDGYRYGGKDFDRRSVVERIAEEVPSLQRVVRLGYLDGSGWEDGFLGSGESLEFASLPFDHPLWVLYSSGTTGLPKPIVHGQGGILLEQLEEGASAPRRPGRRPPVLVHHDRLDDVELHRRDAAERRVDRAVRRQPRISVAGTLWDLAADTGMTCFGTSAAFIAGCMKEGLTLRSEGRNLERWPRSGRPVRRCRPRASTGSTTSSARTPGCSRPPGGPTCARRSSGACRRCPCTWASCRPARSARRSRRGTPRAGR